jgi:hypothetical protein
MALHLLRIRLISAILALGTCLTVASSQDVSRPSTAMVLRQQMGSIADEVVGRLQLVAGSAVALTIEPGSQKDIAENAFAGSLQRKGFRPFTKMMRDSSGITLKVSILTDRAQFRELGQKQFERTVQTDVEVRSEKSDGESLDAFGMFHRSISDTVSSRDVEMTPFRQGDGLDEETTFFQRLIGPLIVLASGIIVVYLFFTVRS